ncbi:dynein light chain roadblock-type 1 [Hippocampus comes]|nr:PREDICTED: dynein light chain roadblock-type 1 [Hippocampus comes]
MYSISDHWRRQVVTVDNKRRKREDEEVQLGSYNISWSLFLQFITQIFLTLYSRALEMAEVEETLKRIQAQKGVQGLIIVNSDGIPIRSTLDNTSTVHYAGLIHQLVMKARSTIRDIDPLNDLTFLRLRSKKNEIMIAPDKDYFMIVIQNPSD